MSKISLNSLANLTNQTTAVNTINGNSTTIQSAFDNTLSRDGTQPNKMNSTLDMNSFPIINLPAPNDATQPVRLEDLSKYITLSNNPPTTVTVPSNSLSIFSFIPAAQIPLIQAGLSTFDCGPAFNTALTAASSTVGQMQSLYVPSGVYPIYTPITYVGPSNTSIVPGPKIFGDSSATSILRNHVQGIQCTNAFSTTIGSSSVTVTVPNHGLSVNTPVVFTFLSSNNIGGLDFDGPWRIASVIDANTLQFYHFSAATSTVTASGNCYVSVPMINIGAQAARFHEGTEIRNLQILGTYLTNKGTAGIRLTGQLHAKFDDFWINSCDDGVQCYAATGDVPISGGLVIDSSTHIYFERARIENCGRWGVEMVGTSENIGGTIYGHNEISNVVFGEVLINACGTSNNTAKYSGGMKWKGQGVHFVSTAFTVCQNVSLFAGMPYGAAGLPSAISFDFLVFENTQGLGCTAFYLQGVDTISGDILEIYDGPTAQTAFGMYMDSSVNPVINVNILSSIVRVDPANTPYTAFVFTPGAATNSTIRINTPSFQEFGAPGQTQVTGFTFRT